MKCSVESALKNAIASSHVLHFVCDYLVLPSIYIEFTVICTSVFVLCTILLQQILYVQYGIIMSSLSHYIDK